MSQINQLQKKIMRRVYYAFWLRKLKHPFVTHGAILAVSYILLTRVVSVPDVWRNLMEVEVGKVASYLLSALVNSEAATWVLLALMSATIVSMVWKTFKEREPIMPGETWALR